jgi:phosphoglycerol geranylgeranyltransferase
MKKTKIYNDLIEKKQLGYKSFAVLIDPDKVENNQSLQKLINLSIESKVDYFFAGGSLITSNNLNQVINTIKQSCNIPVILFPGNNMHIDTTADAILFLSLISGRNPELLIGQHVVAAPILKRSPLEILPTGYMLIHSGNQTSASYMSNTTPIPHDKYAIAACTAMAGEMLGLKLIYMDAGSGAQFPILPKMISMVRKSVALPLIVGGGIDNSYKAMEAIQAGADVIVIGNAIEQNPDLITEVAEKIDLYNKKLAKIS